MYGHHTLFEAVAALVEDNWILGWMLDNCSLLRKAKQVFIRLFPLFLLCFLTYDKFIWH